MAQIVVLNSRKHAALRVHSAPSLQHGDGQRFVPVVLSEFPKLAMHYPILLSKDSVTGAFYCGAMLGFDAGENLFLADHKLQQAYRPLNLQRGPFYTAGAELALDMDNARVADSGEQRLFLDDGEPSVYLKNIMTLMRELRDGLERTKVFVDTVLRLKLIEAVSIDAHFDDGSRRDVSGLYTVDRRALSELADEAVVELFRRGYLQLIYYMLASIQHVTALAERKSRQFLPAEEAR